jgi:novel protein kinase C eta type
MQIMQNLPYGHAVDWWALGIMIYEMLVGHLPFDDNTEDAADANQTLEDKIVNSKVQFPEGLSLAAVSVVRKVSTITVKTGALKTS